MLHLLDGKNHPFQKIVFAAPLVRSYLWTLSRIGVRLFGKFIWRLPRRGQSKKHPIYREIAKNDPRPIRSVPINWAMQLMNWNKFYEYGSQNSFEELKSNVSWTERSELQRLVVIVLVFSVLFSLAIWGADTVLSRVIKFYFNLIG